MDKQTVIETFDVITTLFNQLGKSPIFFGSFLGTVINGDFYREIGDIDVIADFECRNQITDYLYSTGFKICKNKQVGMIAVLGCKPTEFSDGKHNISFLFVKNENNCLKIPLKYGFEFSLPNEAVEHKFQNGKITSVTTEFYLFTLLSNFRKLDKRIFDIKKLSTKIDYHKFENIIKHNSLYWNKIPLKFFNNLIRFRARLLGF